MAAAAAAPPATVCALVDIAVAVVLLVVVVVVVVAGSDRGMTRRWLSGSVYLDHVGPNTHTVFFGFPAAGTIGKLRSRSLASRGTAVAGASGPPECRGGRVARLGGSLGGVALPLGAHPWAHPHGGTPSRGGAPAGGGSVGDRRQPPHCPAGTQRPSTRSGRCGVHGRAAQPVRSPPAGPAEGCALTAATCCVCSAPKTGGSSAPTSSGDSTSG